MKTARNARAIKPAFMKLTAQGVPKGNALVSALLWP